MIELLQRGAVTGSRFYLRHFPLGHGKQLVWTHIVEPRWAWSSHSFTSRTRFGAHMSGNTCELLQQYVYYFGIWEPQLTAWLTSRLHPGDLFVDVGASVGYFSLLASRQVGPTGRVIAFEPSPRAHQLLRHNLRVNRTENVCVQKIAVGDRDAMVTIFAGEETHWGLSSVIPAAAVTDQREAEVQMRPLASLLSPEDMGRPGVVKIDVEGAEAAVIDGLGDILNSCNPDLEFVIEVGPDRLAAQGKTSAEIFDAFTMAGFAAYLMPNAYDIGEHLRPPPAPRLEPLDGPPEFEADLVFSRRQLG